MCTRAPKLLLIALLAALAPLHAQMADIKLASAFVGSPLFQRDVPFPIWGKAEPGKNLTVQFAGQTLQTTVASDGTWRVMLAPMPANSQGQDLTVGYGSDDPEALVREDILIGDIWIAAGQSNMELGFSAIDRRAEEVKDCNYPTIRLFLVPKSASPYNDTPLLGAWLPANRSNLTSGGWQGFSAVGFTFARSLYKETKVPIGLIQTAYGGSPIESWLSPTELAKTAETASWNQRLIDADAEWLAALKTDPSAKHAWETITDTAKLQGSQIWKAMVAPLSPLPIKGIIWYQGETNVGNGPAYTAKMAALIRSYRDTLQQAELPFYYVQLAPYNYGGSLPSMWASQEAVLSIPGTGMVVTTDVGNASDIHPVQKRPVGDRLALLALKYTYGQSTRLADSPFVQSTTAKGKTLELRFAQIGKGLSTTDKKAPRGFKISADGINWFEANAIIKGDMVILSSPQCPKPAFANYAWVDVPNVNLINSAGLPARPWAGNQNL